MGSIDGSIWATLLRALFFVLISIFADMLLRSRTTTKPNKTRKEKLQEMTTRELLIAYILWSQKVHKHFNAKIVALDKKLTIKDE